MLEHLFGSKTRVKLLQAFFRAPGKSFYVRELARLIDTQLNAVRREIRNLETLGLLEQVEAAQAHTSEMGTERSKFYQLQSLHLLVPELKALLVKAELLEEQELIENIKTRGGKIKLLTLTGFFTGATDVDTDILIVGELKPVVLTKIIKSYEDEVGRPVRYTLMSETEYNDRRHIGDKFLYALMEAKYLTPIDEISGR